LHAPGRPRDARRDHGLLPRLGAEDSLPLAGRPPGDPGRPGGERPSRPLGAATRARRYHGTGATGARRLHQAAPRRVAARFATPDCSPMVLWPLRAAVTILVPPRRLR